MKKRQSRSLARRVVSKKTSAKRAKKKQIKHRVRRSLPRHKRFLLHPLSLLVLMCVSVLIIGWTYRAVADDFTVTAVIEAPELTQPATITQPTDGQVFTTQLITVEGTCPTDSYVNLDINSNFSGVAWCTNANTYSIEADLYVGQNTLEVQDYNVTNEAGPPTPTISVTYRPPAGTSPTTTSSQTQSTTSSPTKSSYQPPVLESSFQFQTFTVGQNFTWNLTLQGGKAPFIINVLWGDSQSSSFSLNSDQSFTINHVYKKAGYYTIIVQVIDSKGTTRTLQLLALIKYPNQSGILPLAPFKPPTPPSSSSFGNLFGRNHWLIIAWPFYLILLLMVSTFYLGERNEYHKLLKAGKLRLRS